MKSPQSAKATFANQSADGIAGFDEITGGGLPHGRTTLLVGGPGSGKTLFALQFLTHGTRNCQEPGIFVVFEESSRRIIANTNSFNWKLQELVGELSRGHKRIHELRGGDAAKPVAKGKTS